MLLIKRFLIIGLLLVSQTLQGCDKQEVVGKDPVDQPLTNARNRRNDKIKGKRKAKKKTEKPSGTETKFTKSEEDLVIKTDQVSEKSESDEESEESESVTTTDQESEQEPEEEIGSLASNPGTVQNPSWSSYLTAMLQLWASTIPASRFKQGSNIRKIIENIQQGKGVDNDLVEAAIGELGEGYHLSSEISPRNVLDTLIKKGLLSIHSKNFSRMYIKRKNNVLSRLGVTKFTNIRQLMIEKKDITLFELLFGKEKDIKLKPRKYLIFELFHYSSGNLKDMAKILEIPEVYIIKGDKKKYRYKLRSFLSWDYGGHIHTYKLHNNQWFKCIAGGQPKVEKISENDLNNLGNKFSLLLYEMIN